MRRRMLVGVVMGLSIFVAGCAMPGADKARVHNVTITVAPGATPCATALPDPLHVLVSAGGATILFKLASPGYHFGPGKGITFKGNPPIFQHLPDQSNRTVVAYHDRYVDDSGRGEFRYAIDVEPDAGGAPCHVDPLVVNG